MMETTEGVVFRVHTKDWNGKNLYSLKLDGTDKNDWIRMGEEKHSGVIEEGYKIKVGFFVDRNGNKQLEKVKLLEKGEPIKAKGGGGKGNSYGGGNKGGSNLSKEEWAEKDLTIQYQSARRDGIAFVRLLVENEVIKLPAKTKADERKACIEGLHDYYTAKFFLDVAGRAAVGRSGDELETPDTLPAGEPEEAPDATDSDGWDDDTPSGDDGDW